jgi:predicted nucleic acid-binding protein
MPYLVDSDLLIRYLNGDQAAAQTLAKLVEDRLGLSIITYMEVYQGLGRVSDPQEAEARFRDFLESVPVLRLTQATARRCARLREALKQEG